MTKKIMLKALEIICGVFMLGIYLSPIPIILCTNESFQGYMAPFVAVWGLAFLGLLGSAMDGPGNNDSMSLGMIIFGIQFVCALACLIIFAISLV